ncbi:MAG TPA: hypothetical protein VGM30_17905 [Puia sp.]|jgi:hypothetical protein
MNQENLAFLQDSLKYLGFGEGGVLDEQLKGEISRESKEFQLFTEAYFDENSKLEAALHFRRGDLSDMYFFNKYEALLRYSVESMPERGQTFYINKGAGITFKEAFNLLQGRSVYKNLVNLDGEKYNAWLQLNFEEKDHHGNYRTKQFGVRYGYDVDKILEKYPIRELQHEETKAMLIRSLRKGNLQLVSFIKSSKTEKMYIEVNPQYKTLNIYPEGTKDSPKNNKKPPPSSLEEPEPDPAGPDIDGCGEEEPELMEESAEGMEPEVVKTSPRKRVRK